MMAHIYTSLIVRAYMTGRDTESLVDSIATTARPGGGSEIHCSAQKAAMRPNCSRIFCTGL